MPESGQQVQTLIAFDQAISWPDTLQVTENAISFLKTQFGFDRVSISLINPERTHLEIFTNDTSVSGICGGDIFAITGTTDKKVVFNKESRYVADIASLKSLNPIEKLLFAAGIKSFVVIPLIIGADNVGSLNIDSREMDGISSEHQGLLTLLSARLSLALFHAQLHDSLKQKKRDLIASERSHRELIDQAGDIIIKGEMTGDIIQANIATTRLLGYSNEALLSMNLSELLDPSVLARKPLRYDLLKEGLTVLSERVFLSKNGKSIPVEMNSRMLSDGTLVSIVRDLSERMKTTEQLLDEKNKIAAIFDAVPAPLYAKDKDGRYILVNDAYLTFFDKTREEMLGKTVTQVWSKKSAHKVKSDDDILLSRNERRSYTQEVKNGSDEKRRVLFRKARYLDAHGGVGGFVGNLQDFTDLHAAEERYQTLFTNSPDPIVVHDGQVVINANEAAITFFKAENPDSYFGKPVSSFIHPDSLEESRHRIQALFSSGQSNVLSQQQFIISTGEVRDVEAMATPLEVDGRTLIMTSFRDITEQKIARELLADSEKNYRALIEASPNPVVVHISGSVVFANQAALDFVGGDDLKDFLGKRVFSFIHDDYKQHTIESAKLIMNTQSPSPIREQKYLTLTGEIRNVETRAIPIVYEGQPALMASFIDITDRVQARQELLESQQQLIESRQQLEMVTQHVTNFIILVDLNFSVLYINQAMANWLKQDNESISGVHLRELVDPDDLESAKQYLPKLLNGEVCSYLHSFASESKGKRSFWVSLIPVKGDNGEVLAVLAQLEDITERETARQELAENKELLELIVDTIPGLFSYSDINENYLYVNQAYARWYGKEKSEVIGKTFSDVLNKETYSFIKPYLKKITSGEEVSYTRSVNDLTGNKHELDVRYIPHVGRNNKTKAFLTSLQDVTEQRNAEVRQKALQELAYSLTKAVGLKNVGVASANTLRTFFDSDAITVELYDNDQNLILGIYSEDTLEGQSKPREVPTNDIPFSATTRYTSRFKAQCLNRSEKELMAKRDTVPFGGPRPSQSLLFVPIRHEDLAVGVVSVQSYTQDKYHDSDLPLLQSFADQIGGALVRAQKDAQILSHQAALEKEEQKYRSIIENAGDAVFVTSTKGEILTVNEQAATSLGYSEKALLQKNIKDIDPLFLKQLSRTVLAMLKREGGSIILQSVHVRSDQISFPVEQRVGITEINKKQSILCFARDITDRKIAEMREYALRKLAHDLNESTTFHSIGKMAARSIRSFFQSDAFAIEYFDHETDMIIGVYSEDTFEGDVEPSPITPKDTPFAAVNPEFFNLNSQTHVRNRSKKELNKTENQRAFGSDRLSHSLLFAPIMWEGTHIGVLTVQSYTDNLYSDLDLPNIQTFADQIGSALVRAKKDEELSAKKNELQESEEKYRSMIENAGDALFVISIKGRIKAFNQNASESLGYSETELMGLDLEFFNPGLKKQLTQKRIQTLIKENRSITLETNHIRKNGSPFPVELRVGTMELRGKQSILFFARDVSERKEDEFFRDALRRLARQLTVSLNPRQVGVIAAAVLYDLFQYDAFLLYRVNLEENLARGIFGQDTFNAGEKPVEIEVGITPLDLSNEKNVFVINTPVLINRTAKDKSISLDPFGNTSRRSKSLVFVPIFWEGVQIGLFSLQSYTLNKFSEADTGKLKVFANQIGGALVRAQTDLTLQNQTDELREREHQLEAIVKEKEVLLKEVYHRTKNNMQVIVGLLEMHGMKTGNDETRGVLNEMTHRIYSMSMVHDLLYRSKNLSEIKLNVYLENLVERLITAYKTSLGDVSLLCKAEAIPITIQTAIPLGLVINEVVSNALKHAFPDNRDGQIMVIAKKNGKNGLKIRIKDDGTGMTQGFDLNKSETLGMHIIQDIVELQLFGKITTSTTRGVEYTISIPDLRLD